MKNYEQMSDYEKAVANRDAQIEPAAHYSSDEVIPAPVVTPEVIQQGNDPSVKQLASAFVALENTFRNFAETVNRNAVATDQNFAAALKHANDLEARIATLETSLAAIGALKTSEIVKDGSDSHAN